MSQFILLYGARQVLTLRGPNEARRGSSLQELTIVENGSVLIRNGLIYSIGSTRRIENLKESRDALLIDVSDAIIMPGLVDPDFTVTSHGAGLQARRPARIYDDGLALMRSCLQHGTIRAVLNASAETESFQGDVSLLRQFTRIGNNPVDTVRTWHIANPLRDQEEFCAFDETLQTLARRGLIDSISISSDAVGCEAFRSCVSLVLSTRFPTSVRWNGGSADDLRNLLEQLKPRAVRCPSTLTPEEVSVLSDSDAICVFAPGTEVGQPSGPGLHLLAEAGAAIALSSGYHPVDTPGLSMQTAISLATMQRGLTAEAAIAAATVNAAHAAGCADTCGIIEKDKPANLLVMSVPDYREIPRQIGINRVGLVIKGGNIVLNRGRWTMGVNAGAAGRMRS